MAVRRESFVRHPTPYQRQPYRTGSEFNGDKIGVSRTILQRCSSFGSCTDVIQEELHAAALGAAGTEAVCDAAIVQQLHPQMWWGHTYIQHEFVAPAADVAILNKAVEERITHNLPTAVNLYDRWSDC